MVSGASVFAKAAGGPRSYRRGDVERVLRRSGAWTVLGQENIFPAEANLTMSTKRALQRAKALLKNYDVPLKKI